MSPRYSRTLGIVMLLVLLSAACNLPRPPTTATLTPTPAPPSATPSPTVPLTPSATPLPLPAPRMLERVPPPDAQQPLDEPLRLTFDQPMDRQSLEQSFQISPPVQGTFTWRDQRTVLFQPARSFERGTTYHVTIQADARNAEGRPLQEPVSFDFQTLGYMKITAVQPRPHTTDLALDTPVTVIFNRPVVPLTSLEQQASLPQPLIFDPPVQGEGEWLNTAMYRFVPQPGFAPATTYTVHIQSGLTDVDGNILPQDYVWSFSTLGPQAITWSPQGYYVGLTPTISVTFNQLMDHPSTEAAFSMLRDGTPISGTFGWTPGLSGTETLRFDPTAPLTPSTIYKIVVQESALSRNRNVNLHDPQTWRFRTSPLPGVQGSKPHDGQHEVDIYQPVLITFQSPMQTAVFTGHLTIRPRPLKVYTYWSNNGTQVRLSFHKQPSTTYHITVDGAAPDAFGRPLGEPFTFSFTTANLPPSVYFKTTDEIGTFNAADETAVYVQYRNIQALDLKLYRLSPNNLMSLLGDYGYLQTKNFRPPTEALVREWHLAVSPPANKSELRRIAMTDTDGNPQPPGIYYLSANSPQLGPQHTRPPAPYVFIRSYLNLTLKTTNRQALVWATDLRTGEPRADLPLQLFTIAHTQPLQATGDAQGLARFDVHITDLWRPVFAFSGTPGSDDFAAVLSSWDQGISPWDFNLSESSSSAPYRAAIYPDRPIYRPGQTVYFKAIVRRDEDLHYTIPADLEQVTVQISDARGRAIYNQDLTLNEMGTVHGELQLDEEATLGTYYLAIFANKQQIAGANFTVAEYRKPEYQAAVETDRPAYLNGDTINVTTEAHYYFGGNVAHAAVHWNVLGEDFSFRYQCPAGQTCPRYSWQDHDDPWWWWNEESPYGHLIAQGDTETDDHGRATFQVPADISDEVNSQRLTLEANISDLSGQSVSQRTSVIVHKGAFYIGVAPRGRIARVGEHKSIDLLTVDWDSQPQKSVPLQVVVLEHRWYSVREQAESGEYYWTWNTEDVPLYTTTVTTDDAGRAEIAYTPEHAGSYRVRAVGHDAHGNEIRSSNYFWVWGGQANWQRDSNNRINLVSDKDLYHVGETAEILIPAPYSGTVYALVTIERQTILSATVQQLPDNSALIRIPILPSYAPNVFVSVILVQGSQAAPDGLASFKMGEIKLAVSTERHTLHITLTPDRSMDAGQYYHPRDTVTYDIFTGDYAGHPVTAELSLRLADQAVLALHPDNGPTLQESFWSERGLNIRTGLGLVLAMEAYNRELRPGAKGGGGGGGEGGGFIRTNFADTAFWAPEVRTGADGHATVQVTLPDNLTTWQMQARGVTYDTMVGQAQVDVMSTRELLVRPVLPRFFVVGDQADCATILHNNTADPLQTTVTLTVQGLSIAGDLVRQVSVPPHGETKVVWPVTAQAATTATIQMEAAAPGLYDGWQGSLPIYHYTTPEVMGTTGVLSGPEMRQEIIQLPYEFDPSQGELTVEMDGSLTAATQDALDYLRHYPYECTEQTVSRFVPNVLTYQALDEMGLARPSLRAALSSEVSLALQRLYAQQHYDGGWGWWVGGKSNPYLTAYVLYGLLEAQRAGFTVSPAIQQEAQNYLRSRLKTVSDTTTRWQANRTAFALYVLADYAALNESSSKKELGLANNLYDRRQQLDHYGQAYLAMALTLLDPQDTSRADTLLADLQGDAIVSATGTHWEEEQADYINMNTNVRTTAIVLWALAQHSDGSDAAQLANIARWLMAVRGGNGYWESTHTTAWALAGLIAYMRASGELQGDFSYTVTLNGQQVLNGKYNRDNLDQRQTLVFAIADLLTDRGNRLVIERKPPQGDQSGKGKLYYTARLRYYLPVDQVKALDRGIIVNRRYELDGKPVQEAQVGDVIRVRLTLIAPHALHYVLLEDPLPAGCEAVDTSLATTSVTEEGPKLTQLPLKEQDYWYNRYGWGWWWFSHSEVRDEKVALFAEFLPSGTYEYTYLMRAGVPGTFNVIPATASEMYFPEVFGRSEGRQFTVHAK